MAPGRRKDAGTADQAGFFLHAGMSQRIKTLKGCSEFASLLVNGDGGKLQRYDGAEPADSKIEGGDG